MSRWTTEAVLAEFRRWVWVPGDATDVKTGRLHLYVRRGEATLLDTDLSATSGVFAERLDTPSSVESTASLIEEVRSVATTHGARSLLWTIWPQPDAAGLTQALLAAGGVVTETFDVCSYDLTSGPLDIPVPSSIEAHAATTAEEIWSAHRIRSTLWPELDLPTQADVDREVKDGGGRYIAYHEGRPAGCAGHEVAGDSIRLWGGGVLPEFRGKGAYRGLVAARLADAAKQGGSLAIVHARSGTSAPILRRMGFTVHGGSVVYRLPVSS